MMTCSTRKVYYTDEVVARMRTDTRCFGLLPFIKKMAQKHKLPVGRSWRMDEIYIKVNGIWKYLYRAVDTLGKTVDFLLTAKRDMTVAKRFFKRR